MREEKVSQAARTHRGEQGHMLLHRAKSVRQSDSHCQDSTRSRLRCSLVLLGQFASKFSTVNEVGVECVFKYD